MLVCFMLFYKFLKLSSFLKISFSILFEWLLLPCRPSHLPVLLFHLVCCSTSPDFLGKSTGVACHCLLQVYFQFSYCILQLYECCLVPYYVLFLFVEVLSVFFILLLSLVSILMTITLNSLSGVLLLSTSLGFFFFPFWSFTLFLHLEHFLLFPHFAWLCFY